jgi:hypothetical protein
VSAGQRHKLKGLLIDFFFIVTVIRLEGMRFMRPERSWRPIVTVEIDEHNTHETTLGVDGQNVNQKEAFNLCVLIFFHAYLSQLLSLFFSDQATLSSILQVNVWQRPQSKKKSKKRNLVASGGHCLGELLKKQEHEQSKLIFSSFFKSQQFIHVRPRA